MQQRDDQVGDVATWPRCVLSQGAPAPCFSPALAELSTTPPLRHPKERGAHSEWRPERAGVPIHRKGRFPCPLELGLNADIHGG